MFARLLEVLGVADRQIYIVGTSYGGFVTYNMARLLGPEQVKRVVIASSDLLKSEEDDKVLMARGGVENLADLMLPDNTKTLKSLLGLTTYRAPKFMPEFLLRDIKRVHIIKFLLAICLLRFFFSFLNFHEINFICKIKKIGNA